MEGVITNSEQLIVFSRVFIFLINNFKNIPAKKKKTTGETSLFFKGWKKKNAEAMSKNMLTD